MSTGLLTVSWVLGTLLVAGLMLRSVAHTVKRRKRGKAISHDPSYAATLGVLSAGSARHSFNPHTDIDWDAPELRVTADDPRWVLTDALGQHPWYQAQPLEKRIEMGMWRQANIAKVSLQFESILIAGLMNYTFRVPNGSPEHRYCLHESAEECNHALMFQELVNRIGIDVPGMPWVLRWISPAVPLYGRFLPRVFFFGILAGEVPIDHIQKEALREPRLGHPVVEQVMAIHVAEEARHISFADEYLRRHVPNMLRRNRFLLSLYVPVVMRVLYHAAMTPRRRFYRQFGIPRTVRKEAFSTGREVRRTMSATFGDIRMLCHDMGLMNRTARLLWRICRIDGRPSRYRGEPHRALVPTP